jgi:hypothetical protein
MITIPRSGRRDLSAGAQRIESPMPCREEGFSLLMVMLFIGLGFLLMTGVLNYSSANSTATDRYNEYYTTLAASEAATEKIVGNIAHYFQNFGVAGVDNQLTNFGNMYPTAAELLGVGWQDEWGSYDFMNPVGGNNSTYVAKLSNEQYTGLNWKYSGFSGYAASYRIISNTRRATSGKNIVAALRQDVQVASIPLFEFGVFYAVEMEFNPSQDMTLTGRVHCNTNIYSAPSNPKIVTFAGDVTSAHKILLQPDPDDPVTRTPPFTVNFLGAQDWNVAALKLAIGSTNTPNTLAPNTPAVLREIINIPPSADDTTLLGKQRYYNKADLIILVSSNGVVAKKGAPSFSPVITNAIMNFVRIDGGTNLFNRRENKYIKYTELNIGAFINQAANLNAAMGYVPNNIYIADLRTQTNTQPGVTITNGQTLPSTGLTIATINPLYVIGHYNAPAADLGTTNTSATKPASLITDAITVLSGNWRDSNSALAIGNRVAADTTINAAIVAGIVPSNSVDYSGGVENFLRLLEGWGGFTLTFNGSIVALYESQIGTAPWGGVGVYSPPIRRYGFDGNFKNATKLPPGTPYLRTLIRGEWAITQANSSL